MSRVRGDFVFLGLAIAFTGIFFVYYPATYAIDDECNILSLAFSLAHGTVFLEQAGIDLDADLVWHGHSISKFSPFHAVLLSPAVATHWRLAFLVTAAFFVWGGFIIRSMLRREGLSSGWTLLYFANPGLLYYSQTLLAMVPAAVMGLLGASLLFRERPRPVAAAAALGGAALLHLWLMPVAILLATGWWVEKGQRQLRNAALLAQGAAPAAVMLALYNWITTGSPFLNVYWIIGVQYAFKLSQGIWFLCFYLVSLLAIPPFGWVALSRRSAGNWTIPITIGAIIVLASAYYYRDGMGYGPAGWVPGQRFLLPASLLACVPAARYLSKLRERVRVSPQVSALARVAAVGGFVVGWTALAGYHQAYLRAQATIQGAIRAGIPAASHVVSHERTVKAFAPVNGRWTLRIARDGNALIPNGPATYRVWLGRPGEQLPPDWIAGETLFLTEVRSWVWSRDLWISAPVKTVLALDDLPPREGAAQGRIQTESTDSNVCGLRAVGG